MNAVEHFLDMESLRIWLEEGRPLMLLDVRPASERAEWSIPGSIHLDVYKQLKEGDPEALADLTVPEGTPVVTICASGKTSLTAAEQLRARGIEARTLAGGMRAWSQAWNTAWIDVPGDGALVLQVRRIGKGCLSYMISSGGAAAVIDPSLEPRIYMDLADKSGLQIKFVLETHLHADHLSRAWALQQASDATLLLPSGHPAAVDFTPIVDGSIITVGDTHLSVIHTPGHTPESMCYLLDDKALFAGDTLFLAAIGRPDLHASDVEAKAKAHALYRSLQRLIKLPPSVQILPGHMNYPAAFDERPIAARLEDVIARTPRLSEDEDTFVNSILAHIPPRPPNDERIIAINKAGSLFIDNAAELEAGPNRCDIS